MKNAMKETMTFEKAIQALQEGHRIRRKSESQGFTKIVITEGKTKNEKHGTYWTHNPSSISNYCSFEVKDVIATDWIIDDE